MATAAEQWRSGLEGLVERMARQWRRKDLRAQVRDYLEGLLRPVERKNGWQVAEAVGHATPDGMQHLLNRARWDADGVRDDLRAYAVEQLGDAQAVLVVDETGFVKKGEHSAGVQRQYSGTAGRIENSQIGVFLGYASPAGRVLMDRELYLPQGWADDPQRRRAAHIPETVDFATKPRLAQRMIERAMKAQVPFAWVTGDEVYGDARWLRVWLEQQGVSHVLAVASNAPVWTVEDRKVTVEALAATIRPLAWCRRSAGDGAKGLREYEWARVELLRGPMPGQRWLLLRRNLARTEVAYYAAYAPPATLLQTLVRVAGTRWTIEECFEAAKGEVGLDQYEVRNWHGWYRHITLAMMAHAYLTVLRAHALASPKKSSLMPLRPLPSFRSRFPKSASCCGSWPGNSRRRPSRSSAGRSGAGAIKRSPERATTGAAVRGHEVPL